MTHPDRLPRSFGESLARGIDSVFAGLLSTLCRFFEVNLDGIRSPGVRANAPPPSGGVSSLG